MPIFSLLLFQVIMQPPIPIHCIIIWYCRFPTFPYATLFLQMFIHEYNKGLYPSLKFYHYKPNCMASTFLVPALPSMPGTAQEPNDYKDDNNQHKLAILCTMATPGFTNTYQFNTTSEKICIDTGASACLSTMHSNFVTLKDMKNVKITGIASRLHVAGIGTLKWPIHDDNNEVELFITDALPSAPMGLLCPQQVAQQTNHPGDGFQGLSDHGILTFDRFRMTVPYESRTRLPILHTIAECTAFIMPELHPTLPSLSKSQNLSLKWHNCLSHMNFSKIQMIAHQGHLPKTIANCDPPLCQSCQLGKAHCHPVASTSNAQPNQGTVSLLIRLNPLSLVMSIPPVENLLLQDTMPLLYTLTMLFNLCF